MGRMKEKFMEERERLGEEFRIRYEMIRERTVFCLNCGANNFEELDPGYITCMTCGDEKEIR